MDKQWDAVSPDIMPFHQNNEPAALHDMGGDRSPGFIRRNPYQRLTSLRTALCEQNVRSV